MNQATLPRLASLGHELDLSEESFGPLRDSRDVIGDISALRTRMEEEGYLFLPGYLNRELVFEARAVITGCLAKEGLLDPAHPHIEAVIQQGKKSFLRLDATKDNAPLAKLLYSGLMMGFFTRFLGGEVRHFDETWLRAVGPGNGTPPHGDVVYMGRGTRKLYTAWVPLGDVTFEMGGLMLLEGSSRQAPKLKNYLSRDVDTYCTNYPDADEIAAGKKKWHWDGYLSKNPVTLREKLGGRWLTGEYRAGDLLVFGMSTIHGSLDNRSDQIRLSSDSRYQLASEPIDERWIGENRPGHGLAGKRGRIC